MTKTVKKTVVRNDSGIQYIIRNTKTNKLLWRVELQRNKFTYINKPVGDWRDIEPENFDESSGIDIILEQVDDYKAQHLLKDCVFEAFEVTDLLVKIHKKTATTEANTEVSSTIVKQVEAPMNLDDRYRDSRERRIIDKLLET